MATASTLYKPYSKRSFLRQYLDWLGQAGAPKACHLESAANSHALIDPRTASHSTEGECSEEIKDVCWGREDCQFLGEGVLKWEQVDCAATRMLCNVRKAHGLCDTHDEASLLQNFILIAGGDHYPMLIPQPTLFRGARRPDFLCFVPVSAYQYRKVAILVDRPGKDDSSCARENQDYADAGYTVRRILVDGSRSLFKEARNLVSWLDSL